MAAQQAGAPVDCLQSTDLAVDQLVCSQTAATVPTNPQLTGAIGHSAEVRKGGIDCPFSIL